MTLGRSYLLRTLTIVGTIITAVGTIIAIVGTIITVTGTIIPIVGTIIPAVGTIIPIVGTIIPAVGTIITIGGSYSFTNPYSVHTAFIQRSYGKPLGWQGDRPGGIGRGGHGDRMPGGRRN
jgi:hypothetical protein